MREIDYKTLKVGDAVITRDGRKGRVICTDFEREWPIVCAITDEKGREYTRCFYTDGKQEDTFTAGGDIFLPPKKEYVNLYRDKEGFYFLGQSAAYNTRQKAESFTQKTEHHHQIIEVEL